jgi:NAD(P)-dependent dehydrogenase (short-subunit alcohol dehydrogenase family)
MVGRLEGKVAVITGGASGMGLATVERFVAEGAKVVICDLAPVTKEELEERLGAAKASMHHTRRGKGGPNDGWAIAERLGDSARFVPTDVTDADQLAEAVDTAVTAFGGLDVMYNNAGIGGAEGAIADCPEPIFDRIVEVNLKGVWLGIKLAAPRIAERGGGSIISTSSTAGLAGLPGLGAYSAAKAGVIGLTRVAAQELAAQYVRVNCICPGGIVTPILYDSPMAAQAIDPELLRMGMATTHPIPRAGEGDDIANTALWLASDESSFVTGQAIVVDGGLTSEFDARTRGRLTTATTS